MNLRFVTILALTCFPITIQSQHTFSIVAVDSLTNEIGSAGATCLDSVILEGEDGALVISDIVLGVGAIHSQAMWYRNNQSNARMRIENGDSPKEIIDWLVKNDDNSDGFKISNRQYGIVTLNNGSPLSFGYTGDDNMEIATHIIGAGFSIQGNILISKKVLLDMEKAYLNTKGALSDKLMAAMRAAKRPGADSRCLKEGVSSLSAFLRVANPKDKSSKYGELSLDINIDATPKGVDPIIVLERYYNKWKEDKKN